MNARVAAAMMRNNVFFLIAGVALFLLAVWFPAGDLEYSSATHAFPMRTSFWFVFGMVIYLPIGILYATVFLLVSHWIGRPLTWCALLLVSAALIALAVQSSLPRSRRRPLIGDAALAATTVERLRVWDTFSDGTFYVVILSGPSNLITMIAAHRPMVRNAECQMLGSVSCAFPDMTFPEAGDVLSDAHGRFLVDPDGKHVYFFHKSRAEP